MHFAVRFVNDSELDLGDRGPSVGDQRTFHDVLYDGSGRKAGYNGGVCAVARSRPSS
jgi:hypothetical protein